MKYILFILVVFFTTNSQAQTELKPCKIYYMDQRQYARVYNETDSMRIVLKMSVSKNDASENRKRFILVANGFYNDSAGKRYYYSPDKTPWGSINGKILKTIP